LFFGVLFGLAFTAWGAKELLGRALDKRAESRGQVVVRSGVTVYLGVLFALGLTPAGAAVVKVVDYLGSHPLAWSEIVRIGPVHYEQMGTTLRLADRLRYHVSTLYEKVDTWMWVCGN
jgi:hypothetical protein